MSRAGAQERCQLLGPLHSEWICVFVTVRAVFVLVFFVVVLLIVFG